MVDQLNHGAFSFDDITVFVESDMPQDITEIYKRIFRGYQKKQYKYIRYVIKLTCLQSSDQRR